MLRSELARAQDLYQHVFVFGHAPLLGSGEGHLPTAEADTFRALLEGRGVDAYFNGHNHGYERTKRVKGTTADPSGTLYVTVGPAGAPADGVTGGWFTAATYEKWTSWGEAGFDDKMATYTRIHVRGATMAGQVISLGVPGGPVDQF